MVSRVIRFVRLSFVLLIIYTIGRFAIGMGGVPYSPRGNAMFSILAASFISSFYYGAMSKRLGGFSWGGTLLCGYTIGLFAQILIFTATVLSYLMGIEASYFRHWDSLNAAEGAVVPMAGAMMARVQGLVFNPIVSMVPAAIGRACAALAPESSAS
jgi:hypothetical protein